MFGTYAQTTIRTFPSCSPKPQRGNPLVHQENFQHRGIQLGDCEYPLTCTMPLSLSNSGVGESPATLQELGLRAQAVCTGEPNYTYLLTTQSQTQAPAPYTPHDAPCP